MLLEGLKVVEMSTWVAGPSTAAVLADWGAQVIKVERPIGDATRVYYPDTAESPANPIFTNENANADPPTSAAMMGFTS